MPKKGLVEANDGSEDNKLLSKGRRQESMLCQLGHVMTDSLSDLVRVCSARPPQKRFDTPVTHRLCETTRKQYLPDWHISELVSSLLIRERSLQRLAER